MKNAKSAKLRKVLNNSLLRNHLYRFFKSTDKFESDYIIVITKLFTVDGEYINLGKKYIVNVNNRQEIMAYVNHVSDFFITLSKKTPKNIVKFYVYYIKTDKDNYDKYCESF